MSILSSQVAPAYELSESHAHEACFHCGEAIADNIDIQFEIQGEARPMCCQGCAAVAETILSLGMSSYYRQRTNTAEKPAELIPEALKQNSRELLRERPAMVSRTLDENRYETGLIIRGMTCPACSWLCETRLQNLAGVDQVEVNFSSQRARVVWQQDKTDINQIMQALLDIGYQPALYDPLEEQSQFELEKKQQLKQIGLAAVLGMQVMMISIALYFGEDGAMDSSFLTSFRWVALLLTTPVLFVSARTILQAGIRELWAFRPGMDLAISLGLSLAYLASIYSTISGQGEVYCDTIVMFVLFILSGRYIEFTLRKKSLDQTRVAERSLPLAASRITIANEQFELEVIPAADLVPGDHVLIKEGETIPADCRVLDGESFVNESLLTGEARSIAKRIGDTLIAGSVNTASSLTAEVLKTGEDTTLSVIDRMIEKARTRKPELTSFSNQIASYFISAVILIAVTTIFWFGVSNIHLWLDRVIAILIVCCPCALSLAMPTVYTAIIGRMGREGIIFKDLDRLFYLLKLDRFVFDKTGTCTEGNYRILDVQLFSDITKQNVLQLAAALEQYSQHPIAKAFANVESSGEFIPTDYRTYSGKGVSANIDGQQYYLGNLAFIQQQIEEYKPELNIRKSIHTKIYLASQAQILAEIELGDQIRSELPEVLEYLHGQRIKADLCSGDAIAVTRSIAEINHFDDYAGALLPDQKLDYIHQIQSNCQSVAMIGDGINDSPALSQANISFAIGEGADIAQLQADAILMKDDLRSIIKSFEVAKFSNRIIQQNITWALSYNLLALPFAICGYLAPWMAAIGMSLSSLVVVLNADRVRRMVL